MTRHRSPTAKAVPRFADDLPVGGEVRVTNDLFKVLCASHVAMNRSVADSIATMTYDELADVYETLREACHMVIERMDRS